MLCLSTLRCASGLCRGSRSRWLQRFLLLKTGRWRDGNGALGSQAAADEARGCFCAGGERRWLEGPCTRRRGWLGEEAPELSSDAVKGCAASAFEGRDEVGGRGVMRDVPSIREGASKRNQPDAARCGKKASAGLQVIQGPDAGRARANAESRVAAGPNRNRRRDPSFWLWRWRGDAVEEGRKKLGWAEACGVGGEKVQVPAAQGVGGGQVLRTGAGGSGIFAAGGGGGRFSVVVVVPGERPWRVQWMEESQLAAASEPRRPKVGSGGLRWSAAAGGRKRWAGRQLEAGGGRGSSGQSQWRLVRP